MSFASLIDSMYLSQFRDPHTGVVDRDEVERFEQQEAENDTTNKGKQESDHDD